MPRSALVRRSGLVAKIVGSGAILWLLVPATTASAAVSSVFADGVLTIEGTEARNSITVACVEGSARVNEADPGTGPVACADVTRIEIHAGRGNDTVSLEQLRAGDLPTLDSVKVFGGGGADELIGGRVPATLDAGPDSDVLIAGNGAPATMEGGRGNDTFVPNLGDGADEVIHGGTGFDTVIVIGGSIVSDAGVNTGAVFVDHISKVEIRTSPSTSVVDLRGFSGSSTVDGSAADGIIHGGSGIDVIDGGAGDDRIFGGPGRDHLTGDAGNDTLRGGPKYDLLVGGSGVDTCSSGQSIACEKT